MTDQNVVRCTCLNAVAALAFLLLVTKSAYSLDIIEPPASESVTKAICSACSAVVPHKIASETSGTIIPVGARLDSPSTVTWLTSSGDLAVWDDLAGKPTVIAFVYTRCTNPLRCAAVTACLGRLQARLVASGLQDQVQIRLATLDSEFDTPARLSTFAALHGLEMDAICAQVMAVDRLSLDILPQSIGLQAQWLNGEITGHSSQWFILDREAKVAVVHPLAQPDLDVVMEQLRFLLTDPKP